MITYYNINTGGYLVMTIKELRTKTGLSQSKFSMLTGIPVTNIQHWEQGVSTPPDYVISLLEKVLRYEGKI